MRAYKAERVRKSQTNTHRHEKRYKLLYRSHNQWISNYPEGARSTIEPVPLMVDQIKLVDNHFACLQWLETKQLLLAIYIRYIYIVGICIAFQLKMISSSYAGKRVNKYGLKLWTESICIQTLFSDTFITYFIPFEEMIKDKK